MDKRVGLLAGLQVLSLTSCTVAQPPSPGPPPWFGGRVEMPEYYFAVTLPDDWVAFDVTVDTQSQAEVASAILDPDSWLLEGGLERGLADGERGAATLVFLHSTSHSGCLLGALYRGPDVSTEMVDFFATDLHESIADDPSTLGVEPPERIDLPVGPASLIRVSTASRLYSYYLLHSDEVAYLMLCQTDDARPDDDWLSIAETIEFLPDK